MYRAAANKDEFGPYIRGNIEKGMKITRESYEKALRDRPVQVTKVKEVFQQIDALLTPTMPTVAPLLTETSDVYERGRQFTLPFSFTGLPSISVPCGFSPAGLPIGLQIVSNELQECLLVRIAAAFERTTEFHTRRPILHFDSAV
jgi:aspartyl-tRNA(Asn)/glutamyl-tRNA(Gln) amidotransferase subunit A